MMSKILYKHLTFLLCMLWPVYCFPMELTLDEALQLALQNNSEVRMNSIELEIKTSEIKKRQAKYIPEFNLDSSYTYSEEDPDISDLEIRKQSYKFGISQKIPLGGELLLSANYNRSDFSAYQEELTFFRSTPGSPVEEFTETMDFETRDNYYTEVNLSYKQPLLKGGIAGPAFAPIKESHFDQKIQKDALSQSQINLIKLVKNAFYQTALRQKELGLYQENLKINQQLLQDLQAKQSLGMIPEIDIMSAKIEINEVDEQVLSSLTSLETNLETLKTLLNTKDPIKVIGQFRLNESLVNVGILVSQSMNTNKELAQLETKLKKEELLMNVAFNKYLPQVDLYFNINKKDQGSTFAKANDLKEPEYIGGIIFTCPIYLKGPKENYLQAKRRFQKTKIQLNQSKLRIENKINMLYRKIKLVERKISVQAVQIQILRERMDLVLEAFKERLIDLKIVYDVQDDRISAYEKVSQEKTVLY